jgi:hypothetical protein
MHHCESRAVSAVIAALRLVVERGGDVDTVDDNDANAEARSTLRCVTMLSMCALAARSLVDAAMVLDHALSVAFARTTPATLRRAAVRGAGWLISLVAAARVGSAADGDNIVRRLTALVRQRRPLALSLLRVAALKSAYGSTFVNTV